MKKYRGFTLIEMVMVFVILAIIAAMSAVPLQQGLSAYVTAQNYMFTDTKTAYAMERQLRQIRSIPNSAAIITANWQDLKFVNGSGQTVEYVISGTGNNITITEAITINGTTSTNILTGNVNNGGFNYYDRSGSSLSAPVATLSNIRFIQCLLNFVSPNNAQSNNYVGIADLRNLP